MVDAFQEFGYTERKAKDGWHSPDGGLLSSLLMNSLHTSRLWHKRGAYIFKPWWQEIVYFVELFGCHGYIVDRTGSRRPLGWPHRQLAL
jgi:hypothetical protein